MVIFFFVLTPPQKAEACGFKILGTGPDCLEIKELVLDTIAYAINTVVIERVTISALNWINADFGTADGYEGAAFLQDPKSYFRNLLDEEAGYLINQHIPELCGPFRLDIQAQLELQYLESDWRPREIRCTLSDVEGNIDKAWTDFQEDWDNGGWTRWIEITTRPSNNPLGAYIELDNVIADALEDRELLERDELQQGGGFRGFKTCTKLAVRKEIGGHSEAGNLASITVWADPDTGAVLAPIDEKQPCIDTKTQTPGAAIESRLNDVLGTDLGRLQVADELNEVLGAALGKLGSMAMEGLAGNRRTATGKVSALEELRQDFSQKSGAISKQLNETLGALESALEHMGSFDVMPFVLGPLETGQVQLQWQPDFRNTPVLWPEDEKPWITSAPMEFEVNGVTKIGYAFGYEDTSRYWPCYPERANRVAWIVDETNSWRSGACTLGDDGTNLYVIRDNTVAAGVRPAVLFEIEGLTEDTHRVKLGWEGDDLDREENEFEWTAGKYYIRTTTNDSGEPLLSPEYTSITCNESSVGRTAFIVRDNTFGQAIWEEVVCRNQTAGFQTSTSVDVYTWDTVGNLNSAYVLRSRNYNGRFSTEIDWNGLFYDWSAFKIYDVGEVGDTADVEIFNWTPDNDDYTGLTEAQRVSRIIRTRSCDEDTGERAHAVDTIAGKWIEYECRQIPEVRRMIPDIKLINESEIGKTWNRFAIGNDAYITIDFHGASAQRMLQENGDKNIENLFSELRSCYVEKGVGSDAIRKLDARKNRRILERAAAAYDALLAEYLLNQINIVGRDSISAEATSMYHMLDRLTKLERTLGISNQALEARETYERIKQENDGLVQELRNCLSTPTPVADPEAGTPPTDVQFADIPIKDDRGI